jgi:hypothetical protein
LAAAQYRAAFVTSLAVMMSLSLAVAVTTTVPADPAGRFSTPELWRMVRYGHPQIPASFAMWILALAASAGSFMEPAPKHV